jgi:dTDP-4-amino-4,6-dideoxygalactose transaminase
MQIPFNKPTRTGQESFLLESVLNGEALGGGGPYTQQCQTLLKEMTGCHRAFLTHSGTGALEIAALLMDLQPGDEVIMPSFTFVSTANSVVLRGGVPVFVDIRSDTLNLDETRVEQAITPKTKAIVPVHYGGVGCEMDSLMEIAQRHGLWVLEDNAQGIGASYKNKPLGGLGHLGILSFHETKNITAGEGGALLINDPRFEERAETLLNMGTNKQPFLRGEVPHYSWVDLGSSFMPPELTAAFLYAQLQESQRILDERKRLWQNYHTLLAPLETQGHLQRPTIPPHCSDNAHIYYILLNTQEQRTHVLQALRAVGVQAVFHYQPLHNSPMGQKAGRTAGPMEVTQKAAHTLLRLPLWHGLTEEAQQYVVQALQTILHQSLKPSVEPFMEGIPSGDRL